MTSISERFAQLNTIVLESMKLSYENMDYISSTIKNSLKTLTDSLYANRILSMLNTDLDDITEDEDNDNYSENEKNEEDNEEKNNS